MFLQRNILVNDIGEPVLCDFGFSRIRHEVSRTQTIHRQGGVARYLAPELSSGPDHYRTERASDLYSMGMTFLALATQIHPFPELDEAAAVSAAQQGKRPTMTGVSTGIPGNCATQLFVLIQEMWDHDPAKRPPAQEAAKKTINIASLVRQSYPTRPQSNAPRAI